MKMKKTNISKRIQGLLSTATPKQKAILICLENFDKPKTGEDPTITDEEVEALKDSVKDPGERRILAKWVNYYYVYSSIAPFFGLAFAEFRSQANDVIANLLLVDSYKQEENHLNTILQELKDDSPEAVEAFMRAFKYMDFKLAKGKVTSDGYIQIDASGYLYKAQVGLDQVRVTLSSLKSIILALEEWTRRKKCRAIMPPSLISAIEYAKEDYSLEEIPNYSRKLLHEKEKRGEPISASEKKYAIFPYYDEIEPDQHFIETTRERIEQYENLIYRR